VEISQGRHDGCDWWGHWLEGQRANEGPVTDALPREKHGARLAESPDRPTFSPAHFHTDQDGTFDFGSYVCVIDAPVNFTVTEFPSDNQLKVPHLLCTDVPVPRDYNDAINGEFGEHWRAAIQKEIDNLLGHEVFGEERLPRGAKPIPGKFVLKVKPNADGTIAKFKARWVCQGFRQRAGVDYQSTYAAVCSAISVRVLLAVACSNR
jgi:hypothetical protein